MNKNGMRKKYEFIDSILVHTTYQEFLVEKVFMIFEDKKLGERKVFVSESETFITVASSTF